MRVWIDIDNPPQVQYLLPFRAAFEARGDEIMITARDYGMTFELLDGRNVDFRPIGASFGRSKRAKVTGLLGRTRALVHELGDWRPDIAVSASRPAALAARIMGIPSFILGDYEYVHVASYRLTRSYLVFPDVIDPIVFRRRGIRADRLVAYKGLKEDLTFAGVDLDGVQPDAAVAAAGGGDRVRVLFRPPAEDSHYYRPESGELALALLQHLAGDDRVVVVFSPRYARQTTYVDRLTWANQPLVLEQAIPMASLLKSVDAVISSGGTMLREAAYMGIPAYSIFRSAIGGVDRHLESIGRLTFLTSPADFGLIELTRRRAHAAVLQSNPMLLEDLVSVMSLPHRGERLAVRIGNGLERHTESREARAPTT
jgi:predicted glycosyltransferase